MPIYNQWQNGGHTRAVIWKIEEPEDFFIGHTGLVSDRKSAIRRLEYLATRYLLGLSWPGFPIDQIAVSPLGKPFLPGTPLHFSISHSYPYVAVAIDTQQEVGIDIQVIQPKILRLQNKFLSPAEQAMCGDEPALITLAWAAKEAVFKRYGKGAVDFIRHMPITHMDIHAGQAELSMQFSRELPSMPVRLYGSLETDFAWSVTQ
ncbi:4'-phosphopantetheinyl transferase family protein [Taibaiella chishuiensis]|uniref:4'-phosphopantetheinyl transferase superfamily protein n=1 Tax=Taibaiella chishuiensis TaxID=1434707 RepID=A0A2P8DCX7_9BACT|nr:4'-phosphopantetheinyl transferase superfamily protein [Taibaiella chishuiensis]PSK95066.1 4'-phosphopantetheinyl transferase superfamily protein [Taibaiella chishuiensis]